MAVTTCVEEPGFIDTVKDSVLQLDVLMMCTEQKTPEGIWYLLSAGEQPQYLRCSKKVYDFICSFDGKKTVTQVFEEQALKTDDMSAQTEVSELSSIIQKLLNMGVLKNPDKKVKNKHWLACLRQPMAVKIPLFNPDRLLDRLGLLGSFLLSWRFLLVFVVLLGYGLSQVATHWNDIQLHWASRFFDPLNIVYMLVLYPALKVLHEIGHGLALKRFGGEAKECGVIFLVLMPLPYINASSSYHFPYKHQRVLVGMAGMLIEFFIATCAWIAWCNIDSVGFLSDILFDIFFIGSFSTLVFNLNPLMKFDGYYILSDLLSINNLNSRSRQYMGSLFKRHLFSITAPTDYIAANEYKWLTLYGVLAIPYRIFISLFIALYLSSKFFFLGVLLALLVIAQQIVTPLIKGFINTHGQAVKQDQQVRFWGVYVGAILLVILLGVVMQFQYSTTLSGVVVLNESQQLKTNQSGFIRQVFVSNGEQVQSGQVLLEIDNPELVNTLAALRVDIEELTARYDQIRAKDVLQAADIYDQRVAVENELAEVTKQAAHLMLTAPGEGVFVQPRRDDLQGSYYNRGDVIGLIYDHSPVIVTAIVDQIDIEKIRDNLSHISVMFKIEPGTVYTGTLMQVIPAASDQLPTRFLGSLKGGDVLVDSRDSSGTKAMRNNFLIQVSVQGADNKAYRSANAQLKFVFNETTVLSRFMAWIEVSWLRNFTPSH